MNEHLDTPQRRLWFNFLWWGISLARFPMLINYQATGLENLPAQGPYLVALNHMSLMDSPLLFVAVPTRSWRVLAADKWRHNPLSRIILGWSGAIWIRRGEVDRSALREAQKALADGAVLALAPEGTRSKVGQMARGRDGTAYLASKLNAPIVPVGMIDTDRWAHNAKRLRRTTVTANIGQPFTLPDLGRRPKSKDLPAYTHYIMIKIAQQLPPHYHGYYADSPALAALQRGEDPWPYCLQAEGVERE